MENIFNKSFLNEIFSVNTFKGNSYSYLIESDGDVILKTYSPYAAFTDGNFFDFLSRAKIEGDDTIESVKNDFNDNSKNIIKYNVNSEGRICLYRPTGLHGWFIVTIMPIDIITAEIKNISFDIFILLMAMFVSYISMSLAIFLILRRADKLKINNDSLKYKNDKYLIEIMYNYAKIEVIVKKNDIHLVVANAISVLTSVHFNDNVLKTLLEEETSQFREFDFNIFETTTTTDSEYLQAVKDDVYQEEEVHDSDLIN